MEDWLELVKRTFEGRDLPLIILLGNKVDLDDQIVVTEQVGNEFAQQHRMNYHETSAKTGYGVEEMINDIMTQVYK